VEGTRHSTRIPQSLRVSPGALVGLGAIAQEPITSESTHLTLPVRGGTLQGQTLFLGHPSREVSPGTDRRAH
jgi:hypothetical protein